MTHLQYTMRGCHRRRNYILLFIQGQGRKAPLVTLFLSPTFFNHPPPLAAQGGGRIPSSDGPPERPRAPAVENTGVVFSHVFRKCRQLTQYLKKNVFKKERSFISSSQNPGAHFQAAGRTSRGASAVLSLKSNKYNLIQWRQNITCDGYEVLK